MARNLDLQNTKQYTIDDVAKIDTKGCKNCYACCTDVGDLVLLTPYDVYNLRKALNISFDKLLEKNIYLKQCGKLKLPYLQMKADKTCSFLNSNHRCTVHFNRPNICRMFPLGRVFMQDDFKYFIEEDSCPASDLKEIDIKTWLNIDEYDANKEFIIIWHNLIKALNFRVKFIYDEAELKELNEFLIDFFYKDLDITKSFYKQFNNKLKEGKNKLQIL